jgi:hypothetical protein
LYHSSLLGKKRVKIFDKILRFGRDGRGTKGLGSRKDENPKKLESAECDAHRGQGSFLKVSKSKKN